MNNIIDMLKVVDIAPRTDKMRPLTALPYNPDLALGSLANYPTTKCMSFWGSYEWPSDCYDPWDPRSPRNQVNHRRYNTKPAEDFINPYELRHQLYNIIANSTDYKHVGDFMGFFTSCNTINKEANEIFLTQRSEYTAAQRAHWSKEYRAPVFISDAVKLVDLPVAKVQLPASIFTNEWDFDNPTEAAATEANPRGNRFQRDIPMSTLPLTHLNVTTYDDQTAHKVDVWSVTNYAQAIHDSLNADTTFDKITFDWRAIMPSTGITLNPYPDPEGACSWQPWEEHMGFTPLLASVWGNLDGWKLEWIYEGEKMGETDVVGVIWTRLKEGEVVIKVKGKQCFTRGAEYV